MAGHNKWSKIKHKKAASDAKKSKVFSNLVKLIQMEAKKCGGDKNSPGLRTLIEKAKKANMPSDNIDRAIKKASEPGSDLQNVLFEAYGPGGVGIIITALTDNNNRTNAEIKHILSKNNSSLGAQGSVLWNFEKDEEGSWKAKTTLELSDEDLEKLSSLVDQLEENDDVEEVFTSAE